MTDEELAAIEKDHWVEDTCECDLCENDRQILSLIAEVRRLKAELAANCEE